MRDRLAEELLARVLDWTTEEVAQERPIMQALAAYKYDEYQQFSAGSRFIENLALWLSQFDARDERRTAYLFVKQRLIFCSSSELRHLVEIAYPDYVRPRILASVAGQTADRFQPAVVAAGAAFKTRQRQTLFPGLSDGARIDAFRRANRDLNHEQILSTYDFDGARVEKLLRKLGEHLGKLRGQSPTGTDALFRTIVLLDDFSATGTSYYSGDTYTGGKIGSAFQSMTTDGPLSKLVNVESLEVHICFYMATEGAKEYLEKASEATWGSRRIPFSIDVVQLLPRAVAFVRGSDGALERLIAHERYYDHDLFDEHIAKGGTDDARYGYGDCGLPLVLHHNTPNNSIALLMSYDDKKFRGLFPRIQRHKEMG